MVGQALTQRRALSNFAEGESKASPWEKDPQTWLAHIEELRVAGRTQDAEASFRAFRDRYPDYQLPAGFVVARSSDLRLKSAGERGQARLARLPQATGIEVCLVPHP